MLPRHSVSARRKHLIVATLSLAAIIARESLFIALSAPGEGNERGGEKGRKRRADLHFGRPLQSSGLSGFLPQYTQHCE